MSSSTAGKSIIMVGGPNVGKSHYTFQLYGRLSSKTCGLKLRAMPNQELFQEGLDRLNRGLAAKHTSTAQYDNADLLLTDDEGNDFDLLWPDYGGEQISQMLATRGVDEAWQSRLMSAHGILLFIRPDTILDFKNIVDQPIELELKSRDEKKSESTDCRLTLETQVGLVELLQILLFAGQLNRVTRLSSPKLTILMTCWDEIINPSGTPAKVLQGRLPLLHQFITSNWREDSVNVYGLSALGRSLDKKKPDPEFAKLGPSSQGYVVGTEGKQTEDLTVVLSQLLKPSDAN
ncbi:TRAFAC clade GTPase domain-containing protein [Rubripirellula reticaptiva]|uniref:Double-GTPase 1 domain-containing protein n=1 Tax=Rubripirellula reticaptiva TaxID=2528013 RepID=A0A5C6F6B5_9BACT|nr:hypothetical protein [Rubripirellula reticaptiva]TWU55927.1 hypothetical protein Poly59_22300 [Rubripirellula reticaptiva]